MGLIDILRMFGALALVLGLLVLAVPLMRKYGHRLPGVGSRPVEDKQLELVERLALDSSAKRQLLLVRAGGQEHLILLAPEGVAMSKADGSPTTLERQNFSSSQSNSAVRVIDPLPQRYEAGPLGAGIAGLRPGNLRRN